MIDWLWWSHVACCTLVPQFSSVQFSGSVMSNSLWPHGLQHTRPPIHHQLPEFTQTHVHRVGDAIQPSHPLSSPSPQLSIFSNIRVFSNESALHIRWPKYWSFSLNISPSNEHSGLISFQMDWLDLLAVQGTLKSLLQHHSSKASVLWCSAFFIVQLSHPYITTGKTIALTRWTFVAKVMSLLFNMLSMLVITFLPRCMYVCMWSRLDVSDSLQPHGLQPARLLCPWDSPGKNTEVGCHFLLREIFPTQGSNPGLLHCRQMLYPLSHQGSLPRSKCLLISWLQSPSAVILEPKKIKSDTVSPPICHAMILAFWMLSFKPTFHSPLSLWSRGSLVLLHFLP